MIFDDFKEKNQLLMTTSVEVNIITVILYLNENLFSLDRQNVRENGNLFILFEQRGKALTSIYQDFFNDVELIYKDFISLCNELWREPYNYIVLDISKSKNINGKVRIVWDMHVL